MVKLRRKQEESGLQKRKRLKAAQLTEKQEIAEPSPEEEIWREAIERLKERQFETAEQAVEAVVGEVCEHMDKCGVSNKEELHDFLVDLFETDPLMQEQIEKLLLTK